MVLRSHNHCSVVWLRKFLVFRHQVEIADQNGHDGLHLHQPELLA